MQVCFTPNPERGERRRGGWAGAAPSRRWWVLWAAAGEVGHQTPPKGARMFGRGETLEEVMQALRDLRGVDCQRLTLGQYLRPSLAHIPVARYWTPEEFDDLAAIARELGFADVRSGPLVRSRYHAGGAASGHGHMASDQGESQGD